MIDLMMEQVYKLSLFDDLLERKGAAFCLMVIIRVCWISGIIPIIVASIPLSKLSPVRNLLYAFALRGKTFQTSSNNTFTVPQSYFRYFYLWAIIWNSFLLATTWIYASSFDTPAARKSLFLLLLMEFQAIRRLFETLFVFKYSPAARMHTFGYLTGLIFYTAAPLTLCWQVAPMAVYYAFTTEFKALSLGNPAMTISMAMEWSKMIGMCVIIWGWIHQFRCHVILGGLRKKDGNVQYAIPYGDWFESVSSPHYLAEFVIYFGLVIGSGATDATVWLLFAFVVANLAIAAHETHLWYRSKFEDYPINRRAIIPFLF